MPTNLRTSRMSRLSPLRLTTLSPATDKMVVSKSALVGFCLTAFAGGVVMTLAVDRVHARAAEPPRESDAVVLKTTPIDTAPAAAPPAAPPVHVAPPVQVAQPAPAPSAPAAASPAAAEAVVVQLPPPQEQVKERVKEQVKALVKEEEKPAPRKTASPPPAAEVHTTSKVAAGTPVAAPAAPREVRKVAAAAPTPSHAVAPRKQARPAETSPTEAAPDEDPLFPTTTKKKWTDPFDP